MGPQSTGALQIRDLGRDDDARAALGAVVQEIRRRRVLDPGAQVPPWMQVGDGAAFTTALVTLTVTPAPKVPPPSWTPS